MDKDLEELEEFESNSYERFYDRLSDNIEKAYENLGKRNMIIKVGGRVALTCLSFITLCSYMPYIIYQELIDYINPNTRKQERESWQFLKNLGPVHDAFLEIYEDQKNPVQIEAEGDFKLATDIVKKDLELIAKNWSQDYSHLNGKDIFLEKRERYKKELEDKLKFYEAMERIDSESKNI